MSKGMVRPTSYNIKALPGYRPPKPDVRKRTPRAADRGASVTHVPSAVHPSDGALFAKDIIERALARLGKRIVKKDARFLAAQLLVQEKRVTKALAKLDWWVGRLVSAKEWAKNLGNKEEVRLADRQISFLKATATRMKAVRKGVAYRRLAHLDDVASTVAAKRMMIIRRLERARKKQIKLSATERAKLGADLKLLDGAMKLNGEVHDGSFVFADARVALLKLKIRVCEAALKGDREGLAGAKRFMDEFHSAMLYSAQAKRLVDVYTARFPAAFKEAIVSGEDGFPIISDSYGAWPVRGAPRAEVIEGLPIVTVFRQFMEKHPDRVDELRTSFEKMVRGRMESFDNPEEFAASFKKWRARFDGATKEAKDPKSAFQLFFKMLGSYEEKQAPKHERYLAWAQKLDVIVAQLDGARHLNKKAFALLSAELEALTTKVCGRDPNSPLGIDEDADLLTALEDSISFHREPTTLGELRWNAHELRKRALGKLKMELDAEIAQTRALPTLMNEMGVIRALKDRVVRAGFAGDRGRVMNELMRRLDYVRLEGMSHAMVGTLTSYRKGEKEMYTCSGGNWFWRQGCKLGRWGADGDGVHHDTTFGPIIADVKSMKAKMHGTLGDRAEGMADLRKFLGGSQWKEVQEYGDDTISTMGWTRMVGFAGNIAAFLLPTTIVAQSARMLTYAALAKRATDVVQLARVARIAGIMETGTMATSMAVLELGMDKNIWLGYDGNKGEWNWGAFARTAEKTMFYGATFGFAKWFDTRFMSWARGFAEKYSIDLVKVGLPARAAIGLGRLGAMYAGFSVADGAMGVVGRMKDQGVVAVMSSPTEILKGFGAMFDAEKAKKRLILTAMVKVTDFALQPLMKPANRWMFESGPYKAYIGKVQKTLGTAMGQLQGNSVQVANALRTLEMEMGTYATMMEKLGLGKAGEYAQVVEAIRTARAYHRVFDQHYGAAGVKSEDGYFTYKKGFDKDLVDALRGLGARNVIVKDGVVEANIGARRFMGRWVGGDRVTFMPRKPASIKDGPINYAKGVWNDMTPGQRTMAWLFGLPVAVSNPLVTSGVGLIGLGWQGTANLYRTGSLFAR